MHIIKDAFKMHVMKKHALLTLANWSMLTTFLLFLAFAVLAYGFEQEVPIMLLAVLHVAQIFLSGLFKVAYVVRLVTLKQLGMAVH